MEIKKEKVKLLGIMLFAFFLNTVRNVNSIPMAYPSDELGAIVSAATLAGYDWSGVIHGSGYYGFGFYSLFFGLFRITDSPYIIYRIIVICAVACRIIIIPIVYYIMKHYMNVTSQKVLYGISFICAFLYSSTVNNISNEHPYELMIWIVIMLLCKTIEYSNRETKGKEIIYLFLLCMSLIYTLLLHTRAIVLLLACLITIMILTCWKIKVYRKIPIFSVLIVLLPICYLLIGKLINLYQMYIWNATGGEIRNGSAPISSSVDLLDSTTWAVWFHMLVGMLSTQNIITAGLFSVCIIVIFKYFYNLFKKKIELNIYILTCVLVSVFAMGGTLCAFLVSSWFEGIYATWHNIEDAYVYAYKGMLYVRYWDIFFPPFAVAMIVLLSKMEYRKVLRCSMILNLLLIAGFLKFVIPILKIQSAGAGSFYGISMYRLGSAINSSLFLRGIVISLLFNMLYCFFSMWRMNKISVTIICLFFVFLQTNKLYFYDYMHHQKISERVNASYEEKCKLEQKNVELGNIYVYDDTSFKDYNLNKNSILQFYFMRYTIHEGIPESLGNKDIIITNKHIQQIEEQFHNIFCYELDSNECWYTYMDLSLDVL